MSEQTPLWQILEWESKRFAADPRADEYVATDHLLDWLAERCDYVEIFGGVSGWSLVAGWYGEKGYESPEENTDRRAAIEDVVRQVHRAIGGGS